jgi:outer membrane protein assembly factor BamB
VVGDCVAEAARREARLGDWSGSLDLFAAARADGWKDQGSDAKLVEELTAVQKQAGSVYNGPIPFEATWYQGAPAIPRSFPMAVGGQVVVMGLNDVFTLRSGGTVGWSAALAQPQPSDDEDDFTPYVPQPGVNRGGLRGGFGGGFGGGGGGFGGNGLGPEVSAPRVGSGRDEEGNDMSARVTAYAGALPAGATTVGGATTQPDSDAVSSGIIIVREADADQKGNGWALTALRTTDGKQLWSTRGEDEKNDAIIPPLVPDASFFRSPVVVGRYVYDMAVDIGAQMGAVSVIALDVATGKMVWRTPVGSITPESGNVGGGFGGRGGRGGRAGQVQKLAHLSYNSSIAVSGRRLVLTPDLGVAMCLDRFDGRLDWEEPTAGPQVLDADGNAMATDSLTGAPQRFDATAHVCGDVVVLAPQDSRVIRGVSGSDGHVLWQNTDMAADTLIGGDAARAIVAGKTVKALDGATGKVVWSAAEKLGDTAPAVAITGPSVVVGDQVQVPVSGDVIALSVASGESVKPDTSVPRMTPWLTNDATLQRLRDGKAAATFDKNAPPDDPPDAQPQDGQQPGGFPRLFRIVP